MAEETQYTASTGIVTISTGNTNRDGSGTLGTVITGASNGTLIKYFHIKALQTTTEGMIRIFVCDSAVPANYTNLLLEVRVPAITISGTDSAFEISVPINFSLQSGYIIKAGTNNSESFNIIAEGLNWAYYGSSVRSDTTKYLAATNFNVISTANTSLTGSGTVNPIVYTKTVGDGYNGCSFKSIIIKRAGSATKSMVRIFIYDINNAVYKLFKEVPVPAITQNSSAAAFEHTIEFDNDFDMQPGSYFAATLQIAETYNIMAEGNDWQYYS